jgi:hypothetical protein
MHRCLRGDDDTSGIGIDNELGGNVPVDFMESRMENETIFSS